MRNFLKKILTRLPTPLKKVYLRLLEKKNILTALKKEKARYSSLPKETHHKRPVRNILIYHISGMFYAGTEKNLQLIANELVDEYNVFFMYSRDNYSEQQRALLDPRVTCIEFSYSSIETVLPYFIHGMTPHIRDVIEENKIDLLITSSSGYSHYPFNVLKLPIILVNIFGTPSLQKNIIATLFVSKEVMLYAEKFGGGRATNSRAYLPIADQNLNPKEIRESMRTKLGIPESAFVFGRIGRASDAIFDPIGIEAFKLVVRDHPEAYYLIMSPPPLLKKIVEEEKIPHVIFLSDKESIWNFYYTIDSLAHFRMDGETFGLNIAESMYAGNPIISHMSHMWNAHLEYLSDDFARVAKKDDVKGYEAAMREFISLRKNSPSKWNIMRETAAKTARKEFNKKDYSQKIKDIIASIA